MDRPIYPNGKFISDGVVYDDFTDYSNGHPISDERINEWIDECLTYFEQNPNTNYWRTFISSGNTVVIVLKYQDDDSPPYYNIIVTNNYKSCTIFSGDEHESFVELDVTFEEPIDI